MRGFTAGPEELVIVVDIALADEVEGVVRVEVQCVLPPLGRPRELLGVFPPAGLAQHRLDGPGGLRYCRLRLRDRLDNLPDLGLAVGVHLVALFLQRAGQAEVVALDGREQVLGGHEVTLSARDAPFF